MAFRTRSRRDDPGRIHPAAALSRPRRTRATAAHRRLSARRPGRGWRLAAVPRRRARPQQLGQDVFRAEGSRRPDRCAAHGARAGGDPGARRRAALQRLYPHHAGPLRRSAVARGADDAGRDHAAAAVVAVSHHQGFVLVAHGSRPAVGADGAAPARAQPAAGNDPRAVRRGPGGGARLDHRADAVATGRRVRAARSAVARGRAVLPGPVAAAGDRQGGRLCHRTAQWRRRSRRDFPGDGEFADDVRLPRLFARPPGLSNRCGRRSASCSCSTPNAAIASLAYPRSGIPHSPATR